MCSLGSCPSDELNLLRGVAGACSGAVQLGLGDGGTACRGDVETTFNE